VTGDASGRPAAIEFDGVSAGYGDDPVVSEVSFAVERGEIVGLLGPNGVGKSTLLKCAVGLLDPLDGEVRVAGTATTDFARADLARRVGYVPQSESTTFPRTVFQTVLMGRKPHFGARPGERDRAVAAAVLDRLGVADIATRDVASLSGGQRQKVVLARALAQEPRALVLDEPTSNLDVRHELETLSLLRAEAPAGLAVVHAMHDLTLAARYSDRLVLLSDGGVYARGGPEVLTADAVADVYGIDVAVHETPDGLAIVPNGPEARGTLGSGPPD
jgi:iron complex transport system ATP-binding protein